MQALIDSVTCIVIVFISIQDFRHRQVSLWLLILLGISQAASMIFQLHISQELGYSILINGSFLAINLFLISIYFSVKNRKWVNIIDVYIGKADIILLLILVLSFSPLWYLFFFIGSTAITIIYAGVTMVFIKNSKREIPMVGTISICFLIIITVKYMVPGISFYNDGWILNKITLLL